jgi:thioesterase domain-containing protein
MTTVDARAPRLRSCRAVEATLCEVWSGLFGREVSPYDDFFDLGGDSFTLLDMVRAVREHGINLRSSDAFRYSTPARLAESLTVRAGGPALPALRAAVARLAQDGARSWVDTPTPAAGDAPVFVLHSDSHHRREREAALAWAGARPVAGLPVPGSRGPVPPSYRLADLATRHLATLTHAHPAGPVRLIGFGHHGVAAFELARQLHSAGRDVALLALVEPPPIGDQPSPPIELLDLVEHRLARLAGRFALTGEESLSEILTVMRDDGWYDPDTTPADLPGLQLAWAQLAQAVHEYEATPYDGPVLLLQDGLDPRPASATWGTLIADLRVHSFDYGLEPPSPMLEDPALAAIMRTALAT